MQLILKNQVLHSLCFNKIHIKISSDNYCYEDDIMGDLTIDLKANKVYKIEIISKLYPQYYINYIYMYQDEILIINYYVNRIYNIKLTDLNYPKLRVEKGAISLWGSNTL